MRYSKFWIITAGLILAAVGCKKDPPAYEPYVESFVGLYTVRDRTQVILMAKIDSTHLTITDGVAYAMSFYAKDEVDDLDFCACEGELDTYTSNLVDFRPLAFFQSNCDTLRVPRGDFTADYVTHDDTIYFERSVGDSIYLLTVLRQ